MWEEQIIFNSLKSQSQYLSSVSSSSIFLVTFPDFTYFFSDETAVTNPMMSDNGNI